MAESQKVPNYAVVVELENDEEYYRLDQHMEKLNFSTTVEDTHGEKYKLPKGVYYIETAITPPGLLRQIRNEPNQLTKDVKIFLVKSDGGRLGMLDKISTVVM
ncbi:type V toxin-antitoxin system endoribonuclease antitoxin GhoS [Spirosoma agri]|uniref:Type V toxin-antitoxin system endoribonuclease antitoxin GhoS n=1 Tax=Spirosoma agri TaxID=1987381 RepID=A0A6M0IJA2_9BACT|nr:type V toxin-antitoxin system endoribonuclease antitoxin GhoS [Spirosoma agri]NEU67053.1 type V toxin-antitoxin system endoribonuclease antitoxin GhoS [Spirosoma agri]